MTLAIFACAMAGSLFLTPLAREMGLRLSILDQPGGRKIHKVVTPRTGGSAIFVTCAVLLLGLYLWGADDLRLFLAERRYLFFYCSAALIFLVGFIDDIHRINPWFKLAAQIAAVSLAFYGGVRIEIFPLLNYKIHSPLLSYLITVPWFVLVINAINLIDGVDGLASGIVVFACAVMAFFSMSAPLAVLYYQAYLFAMISGAVLGFLRYNFNPASIFLGDSGSYFLGFCLAGLSVMGSNKTQMGSALLIPLVALGVPLFDTVLAPIRRFVRGRGIFTPDKGHIHHKLLASGYTSRQVVVLLYSVTALLCLGMIFIVMLNASLGGGILLIIALTVLFLFKKIGYLEYIVVDKLLGWFYDMLDTSGLTTSRRTFLNHQLEISRSQSCEALWENLCPALERLGMDMAELHIYGIDKEGNWCRLQESEKEATDARSYRYIREGVDMDREICRHCMLKIELPLLDASFRNMGILWLVKDLKRDPLPRLALRRVEQLRRSVVDALQRIHGGTAADA